MADVTRGPLYVTRRDTEPPFRLAVISIPWLLGALAAPLPIGAAGYVQTPPHPAQRVQNADTSHGSPKGLLADAQLPVRTQLPSWRERSRDVVNTSLGTPIELRAVVIPPPVVVPVPYAPVLYPSLPADTSHGTPKGLLADAQLPFAVLAQPAPERQRDVVDTSQQTPPGLRVVPLPPFVPSPQFGPVWFPLLPASTAAGTPKPLLADAQLPVQNLQQTPPDAVRPVADTSHGTPKALLADAQPPVQNSPYTAPDRVRPVTDTSTSAYPIAQAFVVTPIPPGLASLQVPMLFVWQAPDTNLSVPAALLPPGVVPPPATPQGPAGFKKHGWVSGWPQPRAPHKRRHELEHLPPKVERAIDRVAAMDLGREALPVLETQIERAGVKWDREFYDVLEEMRQRSAATVAQLRQELDAEREQWRRAREDDDDDAETLLLLG